VPRIFVALELPTTVKRGLQRLCAGLPGARWLSTDQYHLTLRFIGDVDGAALKDVTAALDGVDRDGFTLSLAGLGYFGKGRKAHTLWVGVEAEPTLFELQERIESILTTIGLEPQRRKYTPHVTIARLKGVNIGRLAEYLAANEAFASGPIAIDSFALFTSFLSHNGAIYTIESSFPLRWPTSRIDATPRSI
tara:strand:+ start:86 stop:661 length:576 start_codon:yes stop_codon:yes gene_type:complete